MIARPSMGKQISARGSKIKLPDTDLDMPNYRSRALRPGGMKKGGEVSQMDRMSKGIMRAAVVGTGKTDKAAMADHSRKLKMIDKMKKGGPVHSDAAADRKLIRQEIARAEKKEEAAEGMKRGGSVGAKKFGMKRRAF